jgi:hypothetical protein
MPFEWKRSRHLSREDEAPAEFFLIGGGGFRLGRSLVLPVVIDEPSG